jgi:hypothetical protein
VNSPAPFPMRKFDYENKLSPPPRKRIKAKRKPARKAKRHGRDLEG